MCINKSIESKVDKLLSDIEICERLNNKYGSEAFKPFNTKSVIAEDLKDLFGIQES